MVPSSKRHDGGRRDDSRASGRDGPASDGEQIPPRAPRPDHEARRPGGLSDPSGYQEQLEAIVDVAEDAIVTIDAEGTIDVFNRAAERLFGYARDEVAGRNVALLMPEDVAAEHDGYIRRYLRTGEARIISLGREVVGRHKDGSELPLHLHVGEFDGHRFCGFLRDLRPRKQLEAEYLQAQKMEAIGRLAGGVAHDFNNLLAGILGGLRVAMDGLGDDHPALAILADVRGEVERGAAITRRLLDFSRTGPIAPSIVDPCDTVRAAERMLRRLLGEDVDLRIDCHAAHPSVVADPRMIEQILLNLAINARDAMPHGGRLRLACWNEEVTAEELERRRIGASAGPYFVLSIEDTGIGMDEETRRRATEPFFTTKAAGLGTGLGLSTVESILRGWGGFLEIESEVGAGTRIRLHFPKAAADHAAELPVVTGSEPVGGGDETILLVEDEKLVRLGIEHQLAELGYEVVTAGDAERALETLRGRGDGIDLLLTDVVLPGMSGPELVEAAHAIRPGLAVLYMSAFPLDELVAQGRVPPGTPSLEKPFDSEDVGVKVRAALARANVPPG